MEPHLLASLIERAKRRDPGAFDANALPPPGPGLDRTFILVSHAYCKDMDLRTAEPDTVPPPPFREMAAYPYPTSEHVPQDTELRCYREEFNTRRAD
jgi:hypothetical protein